MERHKIPRHQSSVAGKDGQRYQDSSGDETDGNRYHSAVGPREGDRYHASPKKGHRRYLPAHKEGHRQQLRFDVNDRHRYQSSGDERAGHRYASSCERPHRREPSSRVNDWHRYHASSKEGHRRYLLAHNEVHRQQLWFDGNDRHKYQSSGDERAVHRYASSYERPHRREPSSRVNDWHKYQSSGDERRGQRSNLLAGGREGGHRHYSSVETKGGRRNQSIEDEREGLRQLFVDVQVSGRRRSSAKEGRRQQSLNVWGGNRQRLFAEAEVGDRGQSTGDEMEGHRYHAFAQEDNRYSSVSNLREGRRNNCVISVTRGHRVESYNDSNEGRESESPLTLEGHRLDSSSDGWGGTRRQLMKPRKEGCRHQQSLDWRPSQSREKDQLSGYRKDLPPRSSGSKSSVSPRHLLDIRDLARLMVQMREGSQLSVPKETQGREPQKLTVAIDTGQTPVESGSATARTYQDFRDTLRVIDYRDSQYNLRDGSSRNFVDGDLPRTSSVSRLSVDSRHFQTSTPRLSVDGMPDALRASRLHSSRASNSSVDAQPQFRSNSVDSSGSGDTNRRGPSVVARLMGLTELPTHDIGSPVSDRPPTREGKLLQKFLDSILPLSPATSHARTRLPLSEVAQQMKQVSARLRKESHAKPKSKRKSRSSSSRSRSPQPPQSHSDAHTQVMQFQQQQQQGFGNVVESRSPQAPPKLPMSPKHHQMEGMPNIFKKRAEGVPPSDVDQRLHQLRIKNSIQEHKTLKQILEAMHLKGLLHPPINKQLGVLKTPSLKVESATDEVQTPLKETNQKLASMGKVGRSRLLDLEFQDNLGLQDSVKDSRLQEESAPEIASARTSSDRAPAEVDVLRSKRPTGKASRPKVKIRWSPSAGVRIEDPASMTQEPGMEGVTSGFNPSMAFNQELQTTTDRCSFTGSETPLEITTSTWVNSTDNRGSMHGSMELKVSAQVTEEEQDSPLVATEETQMQNSEDESVYGNADDSLDAAGTTLSSPTGSALGAQQEADVEDIVEDTTEGYTPRVISLEKPRYVQEESGEFIEGTSHPSPVSVLDSPSFHEGFHLEELTPSPDSEKAGAMSSRDLGGSSDDHEAPDAEHPVTSASEVKEIADSLKGIYTKVAYSLERHDKELYIGIPGSKFQLPYFTDVNDTLKDTRESTLENQEERAYVRDILFKSRPMDEPNSLAGDMAELIHFDVFTRKEEELQTEELNRIDKGELDKNEESRYKESIDRRLIFDCVNEILEGKMRPFLNPLPWAPPLLQKQSCGHLLADEVWGSLQDLHWPVTDAYDALYALLQKDFTRKEFQWLDFTIEIGEVGVEVEHMIFVELVDEATQNVMSISQVQKKPNQPQEAAAPAPVEDPACRRKELLERSKMDLLAWHIQYQQV